MAHHKIDATNRKLGRIATEVAMILRGKNEPSFAPHKLSGNTVRIENASKVEMPKGKSYKRYSGYPGGQTVETLEHLQARRGIVPIFEHAIRGMLPKNRLRDVMMKNLTIVE